jgi:choline dehydrogenase-like flavoprotein
MAVVDRYGKVRQVGGLRVVDASITPTIPREYKYSGVDAR